MSPETLTACLKSAARRLGFALAGACPAVAPTGAARLKDWLAAGYAGEMTYLADRLAAYEHPRSILEGVRSLLMLAMPYRSEPPAAARNGTGRVSRYAWGKTDYHDEIHPRLRELGRYLSALVPGARVRGVVDTAPLLEREFAQLAGLGWIGKHTLLINRREGSWLFLAALLTDQELAYDAPHEAQHCGTCRACLEACPTQAFPAPYVLDATRCLSYLTIELRGPIPPTLRGGLGDWVFGCDLCQEVCPWNRPSAPLSPNPAEAERAAGPEGSELADFAGPREPAPTWGPAPSRNPLALGELFFWTEAQFRDQFRRTPLWRAKRRGILRNAAIVLGNQRSVESLAALRHGLHDAEPLVRAACAWALGQFDDPRAAET